MSNLALGQTVWNRLFREMGLFCAVVKDLRDKERKLNSRRNRIQIVVLDGNLSVEANPCSNWKLTGLKIGTNTDEDGFLWVRITKDAPGGGQGTVDLYKAAGGGGGNKVATGSATYGNLLTFAASNSSGVGGTVSLGTVSASEANDNHQLQVFPDWPLRAPVVWDGSVSEDPDSTKIFLDTLKSAERNVQGAIAAVLNGFTQWLQGRWADLLVSGASDPMDATTTVAGGLVSTTYVGLLEDGRADMHDETTPAAQTVVRNYVTGAGGVFDANNQGQGAFATPSVDEWAGNGVVTCVCVDPTVGSEQFVVTFKDSVTGITTQALNNLQVKQLYSDPSIGIHGALLTRTLAFDAGDATNFATAADYTITGETPSNTNDGTLYMKIVVGVIDATKWKIQFFSASTYASSSLVAQTDEGAANAVVGINQYAGKGITGTAKIGSAPAANSTRTLKLQTFRTINLNGVPDKFTVALTVNTRGEFTDRIAELFRYHLNSAVAGAQTINEGYARAGTFPAYSVRDA